MVSCLTGCRETSCSFQCGDVVHCPRSCIPGSPHSVSGAFHQGLDVQRNTGNCERNDGDKEDKEDKEDGKKNILMSSEVMARRVINFNKSTKIPEFTISGTLLGPSHVLLMGLTLTLYCCPHCNSGIVHLELCVTQRSVVPFVVTAVVL